MKKPISKKKRAMLIKRDQEMVEMMENGVDLQIQEEEHQGDRTDCSDAFHAMLSDLVLDLWEIRREKGLSQAEIARKMGTKQTAISRFENYGSTPSIDFAFKYAWAMGLQLEISARGEYNLVLPKHLWEPIKVKAQCTETSHQEIMIKAIETYIPANYKRYVFKMLSGSCKSMGKTQIKSNQGCAA